MTNKVAGMKKGTRFGPPGEAPWYELTRDVYFYEQRSAEPFRSINPKVPSPVNGEHIPDWFLEQMADPSNWTLLEKKEEGPLTTKVTGGSGVTKPTLTMNCKLCGKPIEAGTGILKPNDGTYHTKCLMEIDK